MRLRGMRLRACTAFLVLASGCHSHPTTSGAGDAMPASSSSVAASSASAAPSATTAASPVARQRIDVPGGSFEQGSAAGEEGRDPTLEPPLTATTLTPFTIDALAYPNDPTQPPKTGATRAEAAQLCGERGERLCT